jgi:regulator of protease activity HflC (stomatin/prohibitin superfamily)
MLAPILRLRVAESERALLFRHDSFVRVLGPGTHWIARALGYRADTFDLTRPVFTHPLGEFLVKTHPELRETTFQVFELADRQAGLEFVDGKLTGVVAPATRRIYWRGVHDVRVEVFDLTGDFAVPTERVAQLGHLRGVGAAELAAAVVYCEVNDGHSGLLLVDGKLERVLAPGAHAFWRFDRTLQVKLIDGRTQTTEVSGQEILTRDKVSLRLNLTATYRVADPERAFTALSDFSDMLYKELQFGLREAVGTRTLDELLASKETLNTTIEDQVRARMGSFGIDLAAVGVKDIILPGEMKTILNRVVEAEKEAQANLIRRREETAATRSLHNTARMLEESPVLLRLKELEALEKVTQNIDKLTVFGGLDGVLTQLVNLRPEATK